MGFDDSPARDIFPTSCSCHNNIRRLSQEISNIFSWFGLTRTRTVPYLIIRIVKLTFISFRNLNKEGLKIIHLRHRMNIQKRSITILTLQRKSLTFPVQTVE